MNVPADANWAKRDETPVDFFNPLASDFTVEMFDEQNNAVSYTIPAQQLATYPKYIADFIIRHLTEAVMVDRDAPETSREKILDEIIVKS